MRPVTLRSAPKLGRSAVRVPGATLAALFAALPVAALLAVPPVLAHGDEAPPPITPARVVNFMPQGVSPL